MVDEAEVTTLVRRLPALTEASHFDRLAFKVDGKIFATLGADTLNLRLSPELQGEVLAILGSAEPCSGAWGRQGWTTVRFGDRPADDAEWRADLETALLEAWRFRATARTRASADPG